ncbi:hypothetical protein P152DRAFT_107412 [Eremomyces bilateralis CBS 781.70]|uniref:Uncharacterized protein n=1 Tax=Eremomyces bilateralis CBS 781.70 TaxID=1392243 RepID=A0A6G1FX59_9PEZI|nr:uncharacterized protein P152DRAFT_107412 [Eremomyces bilateralis CBS 781.70]KAF1810292.1 hypothetical protein P152DRAFT_107412 [Eremomyces bilateralis CBS 781.70]
MITRKRHHGARILGTMFETRDACQEPFLVLVALVEQDFVQSKGAPGSWRPEGWRLHVKRVGGSPSALRNTSSIGQMTVQWGRCWEREQQLSTVRFPPGPFLN